jgi:two-component system chemotaxis response regulator CheY
MGRRVLVVDDSSTVRLQVRQALAPAGFDVIEAADGEEGVQLIHSDSEIAAVICDVNMPRKNGLALIEQVKASGIASHIPILVMTTEGQPSLVQRARDAGAKGWIVKPFKPNLLVAALQKITGSDTSGGFSSG